MGFVADNLKKVQRRTHLNGFLEKKKKNIQSYWRSTSSFTLCASITFLSDIFQKIL